MNPPTKEQIEAVSNLLQACELLGAKFATGNKTTITMPDVTEYEVVDRVVFWSIKNASISLALGKLSPPKNAQLHLLEIHLRFLRKNSCLSVATR